MTDEIAAPIAAPVRAEPKRFASVLGTTLVAIAALWFLATISSFDTDSWTTTTQPESERSRTSATDLSWNLSQRQVEAGLAVDVRFCPVGSEIIHANFVSGERGAPDSIVPMVPEVALPRRCLVARWLPTRTKIYDLEIVAPATSDGVIRADVSLHGAPAKFPGGSGPAVLWLVGIALWLLAAEPSRTNAGPRSEPVAPRWQPLVDRKWGFAFVALAWESAIILAGFATGIVISVFGGTATAATRGPGLALLLLCQHAALAIAALACLGNGTSAPMTTLAWKRPTLRGTALAIGLAVACLAIAFVTIVKTDWTGESPIARLLSDSLSGHVVAFLGLVSPVAEELFFRGAVYRAFERHGARIAVFTSTFAFALIHVAQLRGAYAALIPIACVGLAAGWLRARTGSVTESVIVHLAYNVVLYVIAE